MEIRLSSSDGVPVYRQIVNQVKYMIASGRLQAGQELPPIRALAEKLVINPNTVVRAYTELQRDGAVEMRHGSGTYVREPSATAPLEDPASVLAPKVDSLLSDAAHLRVSLEGVVRLVCDRHEQLKKSSQL